MSFPTHGYYKIWTRATDDKASYAYTNGWNRKAVVASALGAVFSVATVWIDALSEQTGYAWLLGALIGGVIYWLLASTRVDSVDRLEYV